MRKVGSMAVFTHSEVEDGPEDEVVSVIEVLDDEEGFIPKYEVVDREGVSYEAFEFELTDLDAG